VIDFLLPSLGADMDDAMLVEWLVKPGDAVARGQVIAEVETDKGVIEVECWHTGVIEELLVQPGLEKLPVGTPLARIRSHDDEPASTPTTPAGPTTRTVLTPPVHHDEPTPPVRHLAHQLGVDLTEAIGTGEGGRITRDDVHRLAVSASVTPTAPLPGDRLRTKASPRARRLAGERGVDLGTVAATGPAGMVTASDVEALAMEAGETADRGVAMRQAIARSMSRSNREIPHYYLATRIDLHLAMLWLEGENEERPIAKRILPAALLLKATALAVRQTPELNGHWIDDAFRPAGAVHLGVAISIRGGGLVAPAIHDADRLDLEETMDSLRDLVSRARSWKLRSSEMSDPTITVTSLGDRGVEIAFPLIIPPQVAMVGFGKIADAPVAADGSAVVHPVVNATLAADHRVSDGHRGGIFLTALDRLLQEPESL